MTSRRISQTQPFQIRLGCWKNGSIWDGVWKEKDIQKYTLIFGWPKSYKNQGAILAFLTFLLGKVTKPICASAVTGWSGKVQNVWNCYYMQKKRWEKPKKGHILASLVTGWSESASSYLSLTTRNTGATHQFWEINKSVPSLTGKTLSHITSLSVCRQENVRFWRAWQSIQENKTGSRPPI